MVDPVCRYGRTHGQSVSLSVNSIVTVQVVQSAKKPMLGRPNIAKQLLYWVAFYAMIILP